MQIKILGISGSPIKAGNTELYLKEALKAAESAAEGVTTQFISLAGKKILDCIHCNWCLAKQTKEKPCALEDDMGGFYPQIVSADGYIFATPTYIGRLTGQMASFLDRFRCLGHGGAFHGSLRNKPAGALTVIWVRNCGAEIALLTLDMGALTCDMLPVGLGLEGGQLGAVGVTSFGGTGKFDPKDKHLVLKDEFGMDCARAMGKRVVEVTRLIKAGQEALNEVPKH